jgi:hypothetical protein
VTLHKFWDDVITRSERLTALEKLATFLRTRQEFAKPQLTELSTTDFEGWAKESFQAAIAVAYMGGTLKGAPKNHHQDCREVQRLPCWAWTTSPWLGVLLIGEWFWLATAWRMY